MNQRRTLGPILARAALAALVLLAGIPSSSASDSPYLAEFGDAPDGQLAGYGPPFDTVVGLFPTSYATANSRYALPGAHAMVSLDEQLGTLFSLEDGPDDPADPDTVENFIDDDFDDSLIGGPCPFPAPDAPWPSTLPASLTFRVTVAPGAPAMTRYLNVLIDGNHDGVWSAPGEWIAVDQPVLVAPGSSDPVVVGAFPFNRLDAGAWMRVALTRTPVVGSFPDDGSGWDGSGVFSHGEVEDYLLSSVKRGLDHAADAAAAAARATSIRIAVEDDYARASAYVVALASVDVSVHVAAAAAAAASASASASAAASAQASASASASAAASACASALSYASAAAAACASCACASICASAQAASLAAVEACAQAQASAEVSASASAFAAATASAQASAAASALAVASAEASAFALAFAAAEARADAIAIAVATAQAEASAAASAASAALAAACAGDAVAAASAAASAAAGASAVSSAFAAAYADASAAAVAYAAASVSASVTASARARAEASAASASSAQASASSEASSAAASSSAAAAIALAMSSASVEVSAACSGECCPGACFYCYSLRVATLGALSTRISWALYNGAIAYDVVAGTLVGPSYTCLASNTPQAEATDPGIALAPYQVLFYLQRSFSGTVDDTFGEASNGQPRLIPDVCGSGCDGTICDDGSVCTTDACDAGECTHVLLDCDDGNPCTADSCDPVTGCVHAHRTGPCDDALPCTTGDTCQGGACTGTPENCDDDNPCTTDTCGAMGCEHSPAAGSCDDGSVCTTGDACQGGACAGTPMSCDDGNSCTTEYCNPESGCGHVPRTGSCSDGNPCTSNDSCQAGTCSPGAPTSCDDGNPCTLDPCSNISGCGHVPTSGSCDDGNACTIGDTCSAGTCAAGVPANCDDQNPCTQDGCSVATGCTHGPAPPIITNLQNSMVLSIPPNGVANPYPSVIHVPVLGPVVKVVVTLNQMSHGGPDDLDVVLVGPTGQSAILMSDVGGNIPASNLTIVLDDAAPSSLPDSGPLTSGTFQPTNVGAGDPFPPPAPPIPPNSSLSIFNGSPPAGPWELYVIDDLSPRAGNILLGWNLQITTQCVPSLAGIQASGRSDPPPRVLSGEGGER